MTVRDTHSPPASRPPKALPPPKTDGGSDPHGDEEPLPAVTEASVAGSIRLQSRFSDLAETVKLYLDFDDQTKGTYYITTPSSITSPVLPMPLRRTVTQLTDHSCRTSAP